tara:strand:- start:39 stop:320 length:282 start_codon:yes stop_codon:yes gene_type:complete
MPPPTTTILSSSFDKGARFRVEDDDGGGGDDIIIINLLYRPKPKTTTAGVVSISVPLQKCLDTSRSIEDDARSTTPRRLQNSYHVTFQSKHLF